MKLPRLIGLLSLLPALGFSATPPGIPDGWSAGFVYANGIRIHYYHATPAPGKPVMVMAHGVTDIGLCWTTLTWKLERDFDIYMVDARGHGLSDPFTVADDGNTLVSDLVGFVRAMGFEKPILMGHSMGAATVMRTGAEYPDLARAIIMLDPRLSTPPPVQNTGADAARRDPVPVASPTIEATAPDRLRISVFGSPETLVAQNNYRFEDLVATCRRQTPKWDLVDCQYWALSKKQYHGNYTTDTARPLSGIRNIGDALAKIIVPALILKADAPPDVRKANEEAAQVMRRGKLVHIDDSGHNLHHDQLERTVQALREFFSTL